MATNKNFTMKQYNGTDYDVLYPKNTSQQTLLNDSTLATALGLSATNPEIDQALTEIVSKITALEGGAVKLQAGSYVGTGTYGSSNPCSLTFDFVPVIVIMLTDTVVGSSSYGTPALFGASLSYSSTSYADFHISTMVVPLLTTSWKARMGFCGRMFGIGLNAFEGYGRRSSDSKTIEWYVGKSSYGEATTQCNSSGETYHYFAIG